MNLAGTRSIKFRIVALTALIIAPLLIVFTLVTLSLADANRSAIKLQQQNTARDLSLAVDRHFLELKGALMGISIALGSRNFSTTELDQQLSKKAKFAKIVGIWSFSSTGTSIAQLFDASPPIENHTLTSEFVGRVFAGQTAVSGVAGKGLDDATVVIAVPVFNESNTVEFGLAAEVSAALFTNAFEEAGIAKGWVAAVVDENGNFVARSLRATELVGSVARPELAAVARGAATEGTFENVTLEGLSVFNAFLRSPLTHWTSVMGVTNSELATPLKRALVYTFLGGLAAVGLSIMAATIMSARIALPIANLSRYAAALADGRKVEPEKYQITEIENVRASLHQAMEKSARLAALVTSSGDAIVGVDRKGKVDAWNKGAEKLFGYDSTEIIGRPKSILVPAELRPEFDDQRVQILAGAIVRAESVRLDLQGRRIDVEFVDAPITNSFGTIIGYSTAMRDISERTAARDHRQLLLRELAHRTKNQLAIIQSIAQQTRRNSTTLNGFITAFNGRIQGLAASHDILAKQQWQAIPLHDLVKSQISVLVSDSDKSISMSGPDIALIAGHAEALGLALHELTTNSLKYGALSVERGRVAISWRIAEQTRPTQLVFEWLESGGPKIRKPPTQLGFGTRVLNTIVALSLGGVAKTEYRPEGVYWHANWELKI